MAYIFIDDQKPEAKEFDSNYVYFDENNLDSMVDALARVRSMEPRAPRPLTAEIALLERSIARKRYAPTNERANQKQGGSPLGFVLGWTERV